MSVAGLLSPKSKTSSTHIHAVETMSTKVFHLVVIVQSPIAEKFAWCVDV